MSKIKTPPPTGIFGFIELINPGKLGGTEISIASAARQFYKRFYMFKG